MDKKVAVISSTMSVLVESIVYKLNEERVEFKVLTDLNKIRTADNIGLIIVVLDKDTSPNFDFFCKKNKTDLLIISSQRPLLNNCLAFKNTIITKLVGDNKQYTPTQKEYLFRKGVYSVINNYLGQYLYNFNQLVDGMITDLDEIKTEPLDWIFEFSSLNESYSWIIKRNRSQSTDNEFKVINFFLEHLFSDTDKEIRFLIDKISDIQNGQKSSEIIVCTKNEFIEHRKNTLFLNLIKNICPNYKMFLVDKDVLSKKHPEILKKIEYGLIVYDDCLYRDHHSNEVSLGYVDCRPEIVSEYHRIYDFLLNNLAVEVKKGEDSK